MKARLKSTVLIFLVMVRFTEELTWNTNMGATVCCQGNKKTLIWSFIIGKNEQITELQWFFKETTLVCLESVTHGFLVSDLYKGRVERNGTTGILLKNVSSNDTGEYTLYVKLEDEKERNIQGINLTVVEPPPNQCKPEVKKEHPKGIISCLTSCERSVEWIINGTKDPGVIGPYLVVDPLWTSEQPICCLRDFKCVDDYHKKYCTPYQISFKDDMNTVNQSVADTKHMDVTAILMILNLTLMVATTVLIACVILKKRCRSYIVFAVHKLYPARIRDIESQCDVPLLDKTSPSLPKDPGPHADVNDIHVTALDHTFREKPSPILGRVQELDIDLRLDQIQDETSPMPQTNPDPHADVNDVHVPEKPSFILRTDADLIQETFSAIIKALKRLEEKFQLRREQEETVPMSSKVEEPHADVNDVQVPEKIFPILDADDKQVQLQVHIESKSFNTDLKCNEELQQPPTVAANIVPVKPKHSITVAQRNEDLQQVPTVAVTTDRPLQDSNQYVQIVNNINKDTDFLKSKFHPKAKIEIQASRKDDTDSSESFEWEDSLSELLVHHNRIEGVVSC